MVSYIQNIPKHGIYKIYQNIQKYTKVYQKNQNILKYTPKWAALVVITLMHLITVRKRFGGCKIVEIFLKNVIY